MLSRHPRGLNTEVRATGRKPGRLCLLPCATAAWDYAGSRELEGWEGWSPGQDRTMHCLDALQRLVLTMAWSQCASSSAPNFKSLEELAEWIKLRVSWIITLEDVTRTFRVISTSMLRNTWGTDWLYSAIMTSSAGSQKGWVNSFLENPALHWAGGGTFEQNPNYQHFTFEIRKIRCLPSERTSDNEEEEWAATLLQLFTGCILPLDPKNQMVLPVGHGAFTARTMLKNVISFYVSDKRSVFGPRFRPQTDRDKVFTLLASSSSLMSWSSWRQRFIHWLGML